MNDELEWTDEDLVRAARRGEAEAFDLLVRRLLRPAMALAWQYTHDVTDAEDVVQEAFHRAVRALQNYDDSRPFAAWFYTILRNVARSGAAREGRRAVLAPFEELESEPADCRQLDSATAGDLQKLVDGLPAMQQSCFCLCDVEGFTSVEAAAMLGIGEATVRTHLLRARRRLRAALEPQRGLDLS